MKHTMTKIRGLGFLFWHGRHMLYHLLLGVVWIWIVKEQISVRYSTSLLFWALFGSVFPDFEHLLFFITYGKKDEYTAWVKTYIKNRDWRVLVRFLEKGHKYNTRLRYHNIYTVMGLTGLTILLYTVRAYAGFVFTGAMIIHYLFDILDDLASLRSLNKNWYRWGRGKAIISPRIWKELDKTITRR
jgi:hypothetical protein